MKSCHVFLALLAYLQHDLRLTLYMNTQCSPFFKKAKSSGFPLLQLASYFHKFRTIFFFLQFRHAPHRPIE